MNSTTPPLPKPSPKYTRVFPSLLPYVCMAAIVAVLAWLLAWRPRLAVIVDKVVTRLWPHCRRV